MNTSRLSALKALLAFLVLVLGPQLFAQPCNLAFTGTTQVAAASWSTPTVPTSTFIVRNLTVTGGVVTALSSCAAGLMSLNPVVSGPYVAPGTIINGACPGTPSIAPIASGPAAQHTFTLPQWGFNFPPDAAGQTGLTGAQNCSVCPAIFQTPICAGQYFPYYMCFGQTYTFSLCGSAAWNSNITVTTSAGTVLASGFPQFDEDGCGTPGGHAILSFIPAASGLYYVRIYSNPCVVNNLLCGTLNVQCNPNPPPPSNDEPANAIAIPASTVCNFINATNAFATATAGVAAPALCGAGCAVSSGSYSGFDVWFSAVVSAAGTLSVQTQLVTSPNISMAVYTGTPGALTQVPSGAGGCSCNDDSSAGILNPFVTLAGLTPGSTVYIRVWPNSGLPNMGTFRICAYEPVPPPNDQPCGAIVLPVSAACSPTGATTENATSAPVGFTVPAPSCGTFTGGDVWFEVTMPASGSMTISTTAGSLTNMAMEVYTTSGPICTPTPALSSVGCATVNGASAMPRIQISGAQNTVYYVRMWSEVSAFGTFSICAYENFPPPNNDPCSAIPLQVNTGCVFPPPFTTENATQTLSPGLPGCVGAAPLDDVWFTAVVPASGQLQIDTDNGVLTDATVAVYTGLCSALTLVAGSCQSAGSGNGTLMPLSNIALPAFTVVYIRVWHNTGNAGTFQICARDPVTPVGCYYTLRMADAGGDGWNGGYLELCVGGICTNYTVYGSLANITFTATNGQVVTLTYFPSGGFQNQISYQLLANNGFLLFGSSNPPVAGANYALTVNGTTCNVPPSPPSDCLGAFTVCNDQAINQNPTNTGNVFDLTPANDGCLYGEQQGLWFRFTASVAGNIAFTITVPNNTDYDFAVWGPYSTPNPSCPPAQSPLRCSASGVYGNTGLNYTALDVTEDPYGDKWVQYIPTLANQTYVLYIDNWSRNGIAFTMNWANQPTNILDCTLPLELLSFEAVPKPQQVDLKWVTSNETNTAYFNVERSTDGRRFDLLGTVAAAGSAQTMAEYTYVDQAPSKGVNYYRLDQADITGGRSYSNVVTAVYAWGRVHMDLYPNPTNGNVWMALEMPAEGTTQWRVLDASGRVARAGRNTVGTGMNQVEIDLGGVDPGSYVLELTSSDGSPLGTARFVRQ